MIEVRNLTKSFDGKTILHDVSATFETGKTNLIIGQSGSGKTVLVKSIIGLIRPEKGRYSMTDVTSCRWTHRRSKSSARR